MLTRIHGGDKVRVGSKDECGLMNDMIGLAWLGLTSLPLLCTTATPAPACPPTNLPTNTISNDSDTHTHMHTYRILTHITSRLRILLLIVHTLSIVVFNPKHPKLSAFLLTPFEQIAYQYCLGYLHGVFVM